MYKQLAILAVIILMVIRFPFQLASNVLMRASIILKLPANLAANRNSRDRRIYEVGEQTARGKA